MAIYWREKFCNFLYLPSFTATQLAVRAWRTKCAIGLAAVCAENVVSSSRGKMLRIYSNIHFAAVCSLCIVKILRHCYMLSVQLRCVVASHYSHVRPTVLFLVVYSRRFCVVKDKMKFTLYFVQCFSAYLFILKYTHTQCYDMMKNIRETARRSILFRNVVMHKCHKMSL